MPLGSAAIMTPTQNNHNIIYNHSSSMDNVYNQEIVSHRSTTTNNIKVKCHVYTITVITKTSIIYHTPENIL